MGMNQGWMTIRNLSTNPYVVTITGPSSWPPIWMDGGAVRDSIPLSAGTYGVYAVQQSGYVLYPSEFNATKVVSRCNVAAWSFP